MILLIEEAGKTLSIRAFLASLNSDLAVDI